MGLDMSLYSQLKAGGDQKEQGYWRKRYDLNQIFLDAIGVGDRFGEYPISVPQLEKVLKNCEHALKEEESKAILDNEEIGLLKDAISVLRCCIKKGDDDYLFFYSCY